MLFFRSNKAFNRQWVDHIPVLWTTATARATGKLAIWLPCFGSRKEEVRPQLRELAELGFTALSFDPWQHGERGRESRERIGKRVFGNFRRYMWPILAHTTEDTLRVIDWALQHLDVQPQIAMGGFSMGGDVAVAASGLDVRIDTVAAILATPDWRRPGMDVDPGQPDSYAQYLCDRLNPIDRLSAYAHHPAITFECGELDPHVPPSGALAFHSALRPTYAGCSDRLRVNLHRGLGHEWTPSMWHNSLEWFMCNQRPSPNGAHGSIDRSAG